jgi:hypothetical protein
MHDEKITAYDNATRKILDQARQVDLRAAAKFEAEYSLAEIVSVMRGLFKNPRFRKKFSVDIFFADQVVYPAKGFCALSSMCVYELYGGGAFWDFQAITMGSGDHAPVVFLRDIFDWIPFDATGDQFAPLAVPYELGQPINRKLNPAGQKEFIRQVQRELAARRLRRT